MAGIIFGMVFIYLFMYFLFNVDDEHCEMSCDKNEKKIPNMKTSVVQFTPSFWGRRY